MSAGADGLDALRREIDALDDRIHELVMARGEVVERIFAVKTSRGSGKIRPGREARILRRLIANHRGRLPKQVIARVWREILSAFGRLQQPFAVAVLAPERSASYLDLARGHFGSSTPATLHRSAQHVLSAVVTTPGLIGVLPVPQEEENDPWWPKLIGDMPLPRVITKLPFYAGGERELPPVSAFAVAMMDPEPSGEDGSLIAISVKEAISRARLNTLLRDAGFGGRHVASAAAWHLIEVEGFVAKDDPKLADLVKRAGGAIEAATSIGAYPLPIEDEGLASAPALAASPEPATRAARKPAE